MLVLVLGVLTLNQTIVFWSFFDPISVLVLVQVLGAMVLNHLSCPSTGFSIPVMVLLLYISYPHIVPDLFLDLVIILL
jgi:hypothetical protein